MLLSINMLQMKRWQVNQDNVRYFDNIYKAGGIFQTLDPRPYVDLLCGFCIFYTLTK